MTMEADADGFDWYFLLGPDPAGVVAGLADLVGHAALPPRWVLGYHQARWSYGTADEVRAVAAGLRRNRIPADAIHLDIDHMDRFRPFTWDPIAFADPEAVTSDLRALGLRTTAVVDAALPRDPSYAPYADGHRRGAFVRCCRDADAEELMGYVWGGASVFPDHARPEVRAWWGGLHAGYLDAGVAGFLNDMNEPAMHDRPVDAPGSQNAEPEPDTPFGEPELRATHAEVRNVYGQLMTQATAAYLRRAQPDRRPFVVSRAGFAGIQRDAIVWTGDNWSVWEHLEMSLPQLMNLGLSGIPLAGADIGGFFESCTPELLVRWTQLGAFYPFARNNSARDTARQEPDAWGEPTLSRCRRAIELRYRLLPYLYTAVERATRTGLPVLRPLFVDYPADAGSQASGDVALFGSDLLVAPVTRPGVESRAVYVPPGRWIDVRNGNVHLGARSIFASAGLDEDVPLFARGGAIIPMSPVVQSTNERPGRLEIHVYPDANGAASGALYEDDGESPAFLDGELARTRFMASRAGGDTVVSGRRE
jgi:alpha-glucosidase